MSQANQEEGQTERDEDEGSLAAFGCLGALSTVLESVSSLPHLFPTLEPVVFPILRQLCSQEGQDVYEEVMEILSFFTFFSPEVSGDDCGIKLFISGRA